MLKIFMVFGWTLVVLSALAVVIALFEKDYSQAFENLKSGLMLAASLYFVKAVSA